MTRADDEGRFVFADVASEAVRIVACPRERDQDAPGCALLAAGSGEAFIEVFLRRGAVLEGNVRAREGMLHGPDGAPRSEMLVLAWAAEPTDDFGYVLNGFGLMQARSDAGGSYRMTGLLPGTYELEACGGWPVNTLAKERRTFTEGALERWDVDIGFGLTLSVRVVPPLPPEAFGKNKLWGGSCIERPGRANASS